MVLSLDILQSSRWLGCILEKSQWIAGIFCIHYALSCSFLNNVGTVDISVMSRNAFEMRCWDMPFISLRIIKWVFFSEFPQTWDTLFSSRMSCKKWGGSFETDRVGWERWGEVESELMRLMDRKSSPKRGICKTLATRFTTPGRLVLGISSVQFSPVNSVMPDSLQPHGLQHARVLCPSPTPRAYSNSCP